jgi:putative transcriptional regulator
MENTPLNILNYKISELNKLKPKKGRVLLAEPLMRDPFFKRSVVLLTEYEENGAFGFILNKPTEIKLNEVISDFPEFDTTIYLGGPVENDKLFYIHNQGEYIEGSVKIKNNLYWAGNFDQLKEMIENEQIFPNEIKFFLGYSGWGKKQLDFELKRESWLVDDIDEEEIISSDKKLWYNVLQKKGGKYKMLANFPENPSWN